MPDKTRGTAQQVPPAARELSAEIMDTLEALPEDRQREMTAFLYRHAGPLPDPATFAAYGQAYADAPREILAMAVRQQEHDIDMASRMLASEISYRRETLNAATAVLFFIVGGAVALGITGHEVAAGVLGGTGGIVVAAGAILRGRDLFPKPASPEPQAQQGPPVPGPACVASQAPKPRPTRPPAKPRR